MPPRPPDPEVKGETTLPGEDSNLNSDVRHRLDRNFRSLLGGPARNRSFVEEIGDQERL